MYVAIPQGNAFSEQKPGMSYVLRPIGAESIVALPVGGEDWRGGLTLRASCDSVLGSLFLATRCRCLANRFRHSRRCFRQRWGCGRMMGGMPCGRCHCWARRRSGMGKGGNKHCRLTELRCRILSQLKWIGCWPPLVGS